jgi:virginiamycin A acetyltransferase
MPNIGKYTYVICNEKPEVYFEDPDNMCSIGRFCSVGARLKVYGGGEHRMDWISTYPFEKVIDDKELKGHPSSKGPVIIGNDVWIGNDVTILSGSIIGDGCCIGAGSVVRGKFAPYTVILGNPAKVHRRRFSEDIARKLQKLAWWDWELEDIRKILPELHSSSWNLLFEKAKQIGKWEDE